jgi:hypothetical protein
MKGALQIGLVVVDGGVDHDPFDPAFERAFKPKFMDLAENFDESVLHDIFGIDAVLAIPHANAKHYRGIRLKKLAICFTFALLTSKDDMFVGLHPLTPFI